MLNFFRSESGNYVVGAIVVGIIVVFALEFRTGRGNPTANLNTACAVAYEGGCVDQKDFMAALGLAMRGSDPKAARALGLRKRVLDGLAERELLATEAERLGLGISDEVIDRELTAGRARVSLPAEQSEMLAYRLGLCRRMQYGCEPGTPVGVRQLQVSRTEGEPFDYQLYEKEIRILANRGPKEFRVAQERELLAEALRDLVRQRARVSESEAFAIYDRGRSQAVVRTVLLERSWFAKYAIDTSEAAAEKWAAENPTPVDEAWKADKDKFTAGCPVVSEITLALPPNAFDAEKAPIKEKLTALRERVTKGESFEAVAREASNAPSSAFGGKVGCLNANYGLGSDTLLEAAKKLAPGAISGVLETPRGFHVLRLEGTLDAAHVERDGRKQVARSLYLASAADQSLHAFATELIKQTRAGAKLEEVTRALSDELARRGAPAKAAGKEPASPPGLLATDRPRFEVSAPFTAAGNPLPDVETREGIATRAFALAAPDTVDERPVETASGLVVLQLKEKTPASREEFAKEKWQIIRMLEQSKGNEALGRYVADLRRAAGAKLKLDAHFAEESKASQAED
jgi:peptidyl-prolyl cis-trans isomerase D